MATRTASDLRKRLKRLDACGEALEWVGDRSLPEAWAACERADWMLWLCARMAGKPGWPTREQVVLAACFCAERALQYVPAGEDRPRLAIEAARAWAVNPTAWAAAWAAWAAWAAAGAAGAAWAAAEAAGAAELKAIAEIVRRELSVPEDFS